MLEIEKILNEKSIKSPNEDIFRLIKQRWDSVSKPLDSMGEFETLLSRIGAIQNRTMPTLNRCIALVYAADNGIVSEGVSQAGQEITAICADAIADGKKSVSVMAKANNIEVRLIDVGVNANLSSPNVIDEKIRFGTRDFLIEPAMTEEETLMAMEAGYRQALRCHDEGADAVLIGEIGIGNTTTSSVVAAAFLKKDAEAVTGRGAGLSDEGLRRKIEVINSAVQKYDLQNADPLKVLSIGGGYDIAAMCGTIIGCAVCSMPLILDGMISAAAALVACRLVDGVKDYLLASHCSREGAGKMMLDELGLKPVIYADMALGEGTGAVMMVPLLRTALQVLAECSTFDDDGIEAYKHFK